jgi:hypothetical protein
VLPQGPYRDSSSCAEEPAEESFASILLRHINVGLARGYHFDLMRKSREGRQAGTRQGWHMAGIPPYGYRFVKHEHPNPHKRKQGLTRSRLDLDPVRAPVVRRIFDEYLYGPFGLDEICELLNRDLDRFPPPVPNRPRPPPRRLEPLQPPRDPAQPEIHRLPGLQPPRQQDPPQPRQPTHRLDLVDRACPPRDRHPRRVPPSRGRRRPQSPLPPHHRTGPPRSSARRLPVPRPAGL